MELKQSLTVGVIFLIIELILSFFIASIVKLLEPNIPIFQILFYRYLLSLPLLVIYGFFKHGSKILQVNNVRLLLLRIICGFLGLAMWFLAVAKIDISLATVLFNTMPLFITILSAIIALERVGLRRSIAVITGFFGVIFIVLPINTSFDFWGVLYAILGAIFAGLMFVFIRMLGKTNASIPTAIWYNSFGVVISAIILLLSGHNLDNSFSLLMHKDLPWGYLLALGLLASFQQFCLAESHRYADASALAPFHYLAIPIGVAFGVILFNETITAKFLVGAVIIIASNYYILFREKTHSQN
ncbi:MAG: DMT family transporter [Paracoccaceae bacterium]|mgnify:FL=1|nr:DMT family transporter [Paracoccaceae bacterium]MDG2248748.1 DMT family transporter [Paracoccaceae bacterium]